jgi:hypothetical protein
MVSARSTFFVFTASGFVTLAACLLAACGGSGDTGTSGTGAGGSSPDGSTSSGSSSSGSGAGGADFGNVPVCMGGLQLRGTVNGMPFSSSRTDAAGWTSQVMTPAELYVATSMPPSTTLVEIEWSSLIANGWSVPVTGGFVLSPDGAPLAGMEICPGAGSRVLITEDGGIAEFVLQHLSAGASCPASKPVDGEIDGCWGG